MSELRSRHSVEPFQAAGLEARDVVVERVDEDPVGEILLKFRARAAQDDVTSRGGTHPQLREEPALADPGGTNDLNGAGRVVLQRRQRSVKRVQFRGASDKV